MAYWGVEVRAGNPVTHTYDASKGRLRVSMASLGEGDSSGNSSVLQCNVGDKSPIILCSLNPAASLLSLQMNLEFEEADDVVFSVIGPRSIHLAGYYMAGSRNHRLNDDSESYGEDIAYSDSKSSDCINLDCYEDSFIQDDTPELLSPSPMSSSREHRDKKRKPGKGNGTKRRLVKAHQLSESDDDKDCSLPKQNSNGNTELVSKDDDNCPIYALTSAKKGRGENEDKGIDLPPKRQSDVEPASALDRENLEIIKKHKKKGESSSKIDGENQKQAKVDNDMNAVNGKIQKDVDLAHEAGEKLKKKKSKKNKNKKEQMNEEKNSDVQISQPEQDLTENQEMHDNLTEKRESEEKKVSKKKKNSKKVVDNGEMAIKENPISSVTDAVLNSTSRVQTLKNGLVIEVLESGKPDAKVAVSGNKISIQYVGKLKKTGEVTDSTVGEEPRKYRLGSGKIIEGLEIGLEGIRVGEKRCITVPPTMAYGGKGDGKNVPPDSWLVYEVELVKVR